MTHLTSIWKNMTKVFICNPSSRAINPYTVSSLAYNLWELGREGIEISEPRQYDEYPLSRARIASFREFRDSDCDVYFTWDDDQIFNKGDLFRLLNIDKPIVSAWYMARKGNLGLVVFGRLKGKELLNVEGFEYYYPLSLRQLLECVDPSTPSLAKVDGIGMGACMIKRETVEQLLDYSKETGKPVFAEWNPVLGDVGHQFGEDLWFSDFCGAAGVPIYVHLPTYIGHWAAQGFVIGKRHLGAKAMSEGLLEFDLAKFK